MIRSFAILLVLLFLLNGCRPVGTEPETKPNVTVPTATQEPTVQETPAAPQTPSESDMHVLQQYVEIIRKDSKNASNETYAQKTKAVEKMLDEMVSYIDDVKDDEEE